MADSTGQNSDSGVQELEKLFKDAEAPRKRLEPGWFLNLSYYEGDQWVFWNRGHIDQPRLDSWRLMLVDNRILPAVWSRVARKVKNRPTFVVTPNSYDEDDLNATEIGGLILEDDWKNLDLQKKLFDTQMWAEVVSAGFWKIYWDKTKGYESQEFVFDAENKVVQDANGKPIRADAFPTELLGGDAGYQVKEVAQGDVQVDVLSPFNVYPDPIAEELEECEFIIEQNVRSVEYVKKHYGHDAKPDANIAAGITQSRSFSFSNSVGGDGYKGVTVYELYGKAGSKWGSEGKRAVWVENKILLEETLAQAPFVECPYVMFSGLPVPGRFWPTTVTEQLRGPQTELNKIKSQIRENALRIGNPALMKSRQANVFYSGVPGEEILFDSMTMDAKPEYLHPPEMPVYVQNEIDRIESAIAEIAGIHEVSKATVPSGVTAASAINLLQEADDTRLGPEIHDMETALGKAGTKILKLRAAFQTDQRIIRSAGEDGEWDIRGYRNAMLKKNTNVECQAGSAMPRSKAAKQAGMMEMLSLMLQYGLDINPRDLRKVMRDYGVGGLENMFADLNTDELQIRREHNYMKNGQPIDINDFDNHDIHIEGHDEFRKGKIYSRWVEANDPKAMIFNAHVQAHMEARVEIINQQLQVPPPPEEAQQNGKSTTGVKK